MAKTPNEYFDDMTAELVSLRRAVDSRLLTKEEAERFERKMDEWLHQATRASRDIQNSNRDLEREALRLAQEASREAISIEVAKLRDEVKTAATSYSKAAGEARKEAWRYFGGFWVWLSSVALASFILGITVFWLASDARSARDFGKNPIFWCSFADGNKGENDQGRKYCVFWEE